MSQGPKSPTPFTEPSLGWAQGLTRLPCRRERDPGGPPLSLAPGSPACYIKSQGSFSASTSSISCSSRPLKLLSSVRRPQIRPGPGPGDNLSHKVGVGGWLFRPPVVPSHLWLAFDEHTQPVTG